MYEWALGPWSVLLTDCSLVFEYSFYLICIYFPVCPLIIIHVFFFIYYYYVFILINAFTCIYFRLYYVRMAGPWLGPWILTTYFKLYLIFLSVHCPTYYLPAMLVFLLLWYSFIYLFYVCIYFLVYLHLWMDPGPCLQYSLFSPIM